MNPDENTAEASQPEENIEANEAETATEEQSSEEESGDVNYKAELDALLEHTQKTETQLKQAEHTIEKIKRQPRDLAKTSPDVQKLVSEAVQKEMQGVQKVALKSSAEQMATGMSSNTDEVRLALHHYENTINPSGNLREDMENAFALANRKKVANQLSEMQRTMNAPKKDRGGSSGQRLQRGEAPTLSARDASFVKSAGMTWNPKTSRYEGKFVALQYNHETNAWTSERLSK
jgi:hypothetical protein